jgi:hypothetical protein
MGANRAFTLIQSALALFARAGTMLPILWDFPCPADCIAPTARIPCTLSPARATADCLFLGTARSRESKFAAPAPSPRTRRNGAPISLVASREVKSLGHPPIEPVECVGGWPSLVFPSQTEPWVPRPSRFWRRAGTALPVARGFHAYVIVSPLRLRSLHFIT